MTLQAALPALPKKTVTVLVIVLCILLAPGPVRTLSCPTMSVHIVGGSLWPRFKDGSILEGYMEPCAGDPARGDLVLFRIDKKTWLKIVLGMPGDRIELSEDHSERESLTPEQMRELHRIRPGGRFRLDIDVPKWNLVLNGNIVVNSQGVPYRFNLARRNMLKFYVDGFHGVIPPGSYLVLGDQPEGTNDSTRAALVGRSDIIGFVP